VDVVTLGAALRDAGRLAQVGGTPYLAQLTDATPAVGNVETHAGMILESWRRRALQRAAREADTKAAAGESADEVARALRGEIDRVECTSSRPSLPFVWVGDLGELHKPEPLRWLLRDVRTNKPFMRTGECAVLGGDGGVGKGFFWLMLATCIALGRDLFGALRPEQQGRVALLVGEDSQKEIHHRLHRIANAFALSPDEIAQVQERVGVLPLAGQQVNLLALDSARAPIRTATFEALVGQLGELATKGGFEWSFVGLDPLARFGAANVETDQAAATAFVQALEAMAARLPGGPAIGVTHHSSAASVGSGRSNVRGVTGLRNAFRLAMILDAYETSTGLRGVLLRNDKNNLAPMAPPLWLVRLDNEPMANGRWLETAGVLRRATEDEARGFDGMAGTAAAATRAQREQAKQAAKGDRFRAQCEEVLALLPVAPEHVSRGELLSRLAAAGKPCSHHTLDLWLDALGDRVTDLSGGARSRPRQYARQR
jgi:hypothetical protein